MKLKQCSCIILILSTALLLTLIHLNHPLPSPMLYIRSRDSHVTTLSAEVHWELYQYQTLRKQCEEGGYNSSVWVTNTSDSDVNIVQVLVLSHVLTRLSCVRSKVVLRPPEFRQHGLEVLERSGFEFRVVENSEVLAELRGFEGFDKVVFIDSTIFPVLSLDGIFDMISENTTVVSSSSPNASKLMGLVPGSPPPRDVTTYHVVSRDYPRLAVDLTEVEGPPVWEWDGKPTRQEAGLVDAPLVGTTQLYRFWWKMLYESLEGCDGWHWWHESQVYKKFLHSDPLRDFRAVDIY